MDSLALFIQQRVFSVLEELEMLQALADDLPEPYRSEIKADLSRVSIG